MSTAHGKQPTELTPEQEEEQKQKERFIDPIEQDTESTFSQLFTFAAAMGWGKIKGDRDKFELFRDISDSRLSGILLDSSNPQNVKIAKDFLASAKNEFDRENFDPKTKTYKKTTATRGSLWGKATISIDTLTKADQQIAVGERFHSLINSHETNTRIDQTTSIYGIEDRGAFANNLSKWMKENPDKKFDDALHIVGERQFKLEKAGAEDAELDKDQGDTLKSRQTQLSQQELELKKEAHQKALEYGKSIKPEAEGVMTKINTSGTGLNSDQLKTELNAIGKPIQEPISPPPSPAPVTLETLSTPPAPHLEMDELYGEMMGEEVIIPSASLQGAVHASDRPVQTSNSGSISLDALSSGQTEFHPQMNELHKEMMGGGPPISTKGLKGLLGKAAGLFSKLKSLASTLSNATLAIPGLGEVVKGIQLAKKVLDRIPIIGEAVNNAINNAFSTLLKVFGLSLAAIFLFLLIFMTSFSDPSTLFSPTPNLRASIRSNLSWGTFEKDYLQIAQKKEEKDLSWNEFQKKFLSSSKIYLSETSTR